MKTITRTYSAKLYVEAPVVWSQSRERGGRKRERETESSIGG